jgi:hypothetical protein
LFKFEWSHKIQGLVWPLGIIIVPPLVHQLAYVGQRAKQVGVEQFAAKRAVEAFDVRILRRLAGLNPVQNNTLLLRSLARFGAAKLRAVIGAQLRGATRALD